MIPHVGQVVQVWRESPYKPHHGAWGLVKAIKGVSLGTPAAIWAEVLIGDTMINIALRFLRPAAPSLERMTPLQCALLRALEALSQSIAELAAGTQASRARVYRVLRGLRSRGLVVRVGYGRWQISALGRQLVEAPAQPAPLLEESIG